MHDKGKSVVLKQGVRLYRQSRSKYWWAAIRLDGEEVRKSTKSEEVADATVVALEIAAEIKVKKAHGISLNNTPGFAKIAGSVVEQLETTQYGKENDKSIIGIIHNYLVPYFNRTPIDKVDRPMIYGFYQWREQQTGKEISPTQRSNTDSALRRIFNLACDQGHIKQSEIPQLPKPAVRKKQARDYFAPDELNQVFSLKNLTGFVEKSRNYKTRTYRQIFQYYMAFLFFTGARPGEEVVQLTYGDIRFQKHKGKNRCVATITKGKTTRYRDGRQIFVDDMAKAALKKLIKLSSKHSTFGELKRVMEAHPDDKIFQAHFEDGTSKLPQFYNVMPQYMEYIGLTEKGHTLYSFRHSYITYSLLRDVSAYDVAKQCGTSEAMIEEFYDHVKPLQRADQLEIPSIDGAASLSEWLFGGE